MRLELGAFPVRRACLGGPTEYAGGDLTIDSRAVRELVLRDQRIRDVTLELVHPGESVRVLRALDAIGPLHKVSGGPSAFPGFNGPPQTCGTGRTHRLSGFTIVQVTEFPFPVSGVQAFREGILEMSGRGAIYSGCADRVNLLLLLTPGQASTNLDYDDALRRAALRVADYLASVTADLIPPHMEIFDLGERKPGLPCVVWVHQIRSQGPMVRTFLYGAELDNLVPTLMHPNELLDGAIISANYKTGSKTPTYMHTRHPSLLALYRRHGRDLNFVGVIIANGYHENEFLKARSAQFVAKLARMVRADGALCTYEGTGNAHIDFMLTVQSLERAGIRTAAVVHEYGGPQGTDAPLVDFVPEAMALASSGAIDRRVHLPAVQRVIGSTNLAHQDGEAQCELDLPIQELYAATIEMNERGIIAEEY